MAITLKSSEEIIKLREGGRRLAGILAELKKHVVPGATGAELEALTRELVSKSGDTPAFLDYKPRGAKRPFPAALCFSVNDEVVHGVPNEREKVLKEGDIVTLDMGLVHEGLYTDMAITVPVGVVSKEAKKLIRMTEEAMYAGIKAIRPGATVGDIGAAIEGYVHADGYGIVRELAGHGVGYSVHEDPYVPNFGNPGEGPELKPGMVIAIEPMLTIGKPAIKLDADGFTYRTKDGSLAAHCERTVAITEKGALVLTKE
jgi:methionyl aminopeptidase